MTLSTGTPLNNNISELFNLLHFIGPSFFRTRLLGILTLAILEDPTQWGNSAELQEKYLELTTAKVDEIRGILKPYFLRRTKELVLDLPPLVLSSLSSFLDHLN